MERGSNRRLQRLWQISRALAAVLILVAIPADLLDSTCDSFVDDGTAEGISISGARSSTHPADPCDVACVPDCYGCSPTVIRAFFVVVPTQGPLTRAPRLVFAAPVVGIRPVPYHPPLDLA
jgi:hypothetical protein